MARKFKHGRILSHKKGRQITGGGSGKGTMRKNWWEVACAKHGIKEGNNNVAVIKVSPPANKKERFGGLGCPRCD